MNHQFEKFATYASGTCYQCVMCHLQYDTYINDTTIYCRGHKFHFSIDLNQVFPCEQLLVNRVMDE